MLYWKTSNQLSPSTIPDWDALSNAVLGAQVHSGRRFGFQLSREALRLSLEEVGCKKQIQELHLEGHARLKHHTTFTLSLTHTSQWGAAVVGKSSDYRAVGIDLEPKNRIVKPEVIARISHPQDLPLHNMQTWTLKEAIFKACMNTELFQKPIEFSSILIKKSSWEQESGLRGEWKLIDHQDQQVALAWIKV